MGIFSFSIFFFSEYPRARARSRSLLFRNPYSAIVPILQRTLIFMSIVRYSDRRCFIDIFVHKTSSDVLHVLKNKTKRQYRFLSRWESRSEEEDEEGKSLRKKKKKKKENSAKCVRRGNGSTEHPPLHLSSRPLPFHRMEKFYDLGSRGIAWARNFIQVLIISWYMSSCVFVYMYNVCITITVL